MLFPLMPEIPFPLTAPNPTSQLRTASYLPNESTPHRSFEKVWASPLGSSAPVVPGLGFSPSLSWLHPWAGVPLTPAEHLITLVMISGVSSSPSALPAPSQRLWPGNNPHELSLQGHNEGYSQRSLISQKRSSFWDMARVGVVVEGLVNRTRVFLTPLLLA